MLLRFFRNCCCILWKPPSQCAHQHRQRPIRLPQYQYMIWILLLFLLSQQSGSQCRPMEKMNHRIQRRFMWKQMDSTVDGIVGRVVLGARAMKGMIGDFIPPKQGNVMDYLPTETTRVRYVIRNPHTKETKVIKLRPSKKVVKIMAITPKPLLSNSEKQKATHNMLNAEKLRQIEKEQELIAEGKMPKKHEGPNPMFMALKSEKNKEFPSKNQLNKPSQSDEDVIRGSFNEFDDSWKPVQANSEYLPVFSTQKPQPMSILHTGVIDELLPQPQKQVYEPSPDTSGYGEQDTNKAHTYEVTEYTAEESVVQPYTHEYYAYKSDPLSSLKLKTAQRHSLKSEIRDNDESSKKIEVTNEPYVPQYGAQREFVPSKSSSYSRPETSTVVSSITTTEEPNYPAGYWRKYRERTESRYQTKLSERTKQPKITLENSWQPSNITYSNHKQAPKVLHQQHRYQSQKWPPELEQSQNSGSSYDALITTDPPNSLQDLTTHSPFSLSLSLSSNSHIRKNVRFKSNPTDTSVSSSNAADTESHHHNHLSHHHQQYHKPRNVRQRGSIRFGDKLEAGEIA